MRWLLAVFFLGCGVQQPDYVSSHGVKYFFDTEQWSPESIEAQEQGFLAALPDRYCQGTSRALSRTVVFVEPAPIPCASGLCNGIEDYNVLWVRDLGSPGRSALTHEMAHWLQEDIFKVVDYRHVEKDLWAAADRIYELTGR